MTFSCYILLRDTSGHLMRVHYRKYVAESVPDHLNKWFEWMCPACILLIAVAFCVVHFRATEQKGHEQLQQLCICRSLLLILNTSSCWDASRPEEQIISVKKTCVWLFLHITGTCNDKLSHTLAVVNGMWHHWLDQAGCLMAKAQVLLVHYLHIWI